MNRILNATTQIPACPPELLKIKPTRRINYKLLSFKRRPFTKDLAWEFIEMDTSVAEREIHDAHVRYLFREMMSGRFLGDFTMLASCECGWDGKVRRLNGQHTSWMRDWIADDEWCPIVNVIRYRVEDERDYRELYAAIDRAYGRSPQHVVRSRLLETHGYHGLQASDINRLATGFRMWSGRSSFTPQPIDETCDAMEGSARGLVYKVSKFLRNVTHDNAPHMHSRAPVNGAMFATFSKALADSTKFWTIVRDGGQAADHPAQLLLRYLTSAQIHSNCSCRRNVKSTTRELMYRICISAWNAYRRKQKLKNLVIPDKRIPAL